MYNEDQKIRYIEAVSDRFSEKNLENIISAFNKVEPIETRLGKDCCNFSTYEIQNCFAMTSYKNKYTLNVFHSNLKNYATWCNENFLIDDGINHYMEFSFSDFQMFIDKRFESKRYVTRKELLNLIRNVVNPRDQFIIISLFEFGKTDGYSDIVNIKLSDIDQDNLTANLYTGRTVNVSKELIYIAIEADKETQLYPYNGVNFSRTMIYKYNLDKIVKFYREINPNTIVKTISTIVKKNIISLGGYEGISSDTIVNSGQMEMIRRRSKELDISYENYVNNYYAELQNQYGAVPKSSKLLFDKVKDYL